MVLGPRLLLRREQLCTRLFLLRVEREQVPDLLLQPLPLSLQTADFLRHEHHFSRELFLEVLDVHLDVDLGGLFHSFDEAETLTPDLVGQLGPKRAQHAFLVLSLAINEPHYRLSRQHVPRLSIFLEVLLHGRDEAVDGGMEGNRAFLLALRLDQEPANIRQ